MHRLTPQHVEAFLSGKLESGLSPRTVEYLRAVLRQALNRAIKWGYLTRNVAALADGPRVERPEIRPFTPDQARLFLASVRGDRVEALYSVALALGLRQGEALGLLWEDVDLEAGTLAVRHALQRVDGRLQLVEPKTFRSRRNLFMPRVVVEALNAHRKRQLLDRLVAGSRWTEAGLVFTSSIGTPLDGRNVTQRFQAQVERAGLPRQRFHDLRHGCASLLLAQGVSPRVVMETLGHSQIGLTLGTYSHVIPALQRDAADQMERVLTGS
jgi:integrase